MLVIARKTSYSLIGICLLTLISCKGEQSDLSEETNTEDIRESKNLVVPRETMVSVYRVEGQDSAGTPLIGEVKINGDTGAGYIAKDSTVAKIYIEVRRSPEGGLIGIDTNGNEYKLAFITSGE